MTESDRVGKSDNFNFRVFPSFLQVCEKRSQATRKKYGMFAQLWFCYISIAKVWLLDYKCVLLTKIFSFDAYQTLSSIIVHLMETQNSYFNIFFSQVLKFEMQKYT